MKDIDFLPARYREARVAHKNRIWGATILIAFGGLVGTAFAGQWWVRSSLQKELDLADRDYQETRIAQQAMEQVESQVREIGREAELLTYLRHPWPRTQILRRVTTHLPHEVTLEKLHISRGEAKIDKTLAVGIIKPADTTTAKTTPEAGSPAERDLKRLREDCDSRQVVVVIEGFATDLTALHVYLNALAAEPLFAQAELTSIESVEKSHQRRSQFAARLVLATGYGQRGAASEKSSNMAAPTAAAGNSATSTGPKT